MKAALKPSVWWRKKKLSSWLVLPLSSAHRVFLQNPVSVYMETSFKKNVAAI